jgi:hypothetical protein
MALVPLTAMAQSANPPDLEKRVTTPAMADDLLKQVEAQVGSLCGLTVSGRVDLKLVDRQEMDALYRGSYAGAEIGLYRRGPGGRHEIYVMKGLSVGMCAGIMAHEYTHAWQSEHCLPHLSPILREGFARWVEAKYCEKVGARTMLWCINEEADPISGVPEPVYGVGYKTMTGWEAKWGAPGLVKLVQHITTVEEGQTANP